MRAVRTVPLQRLFQLGTSLVGKVRQLAVALLRRTPYARLRPGLELFEDEDGEVLAAVSLARPLFPRPPGPAARAGERPFATLADLQTATAGAGTGGRRRHPAVTAWACGPSCWRASGLARLGVGDLSGVGRRDPGAHRCWRAALLGLPPAGPRR